jgi:hypothetical protein
MKKLKFICFILAAFLSLCIILTGCGNTDTPPKDTSHGTTDIEKEETTYAEKITEIPDVNFADAATVTDDGLIYVVTTEHFYSISTDGTVTNIDVPEEWMYLCKDSIVEVNRDIYVGTHCGILRYEPDMDKFTWFPADYENMIIK